jgi:transketolase
MKLNIIPKSEFDRVQAVSVEYDKLNVIADMCRVNALAVVKKAGSGHLGSSFSAMDIMVHLYYREMNIRNLGLNSPNRDIYFSSKGHDVPGLYAVLFSLGLLPEEKLLRLRRFGGLDGHPDIGIHGVDANTGSLGMGISKGRGMAWAKKYLGRTGKVFVMTGDGEWQEGQNFEALQSTVSQKIGNLIVIVDHNKVQSDKLVTEIVDLGNLEEKFQCFGWHVARCDGHDHRKLAEVFNELRDVTDRPKILIADTVKGKGISFMEHPRALKDAGGYYKWHSGAPEDNFYTAGHSELIERINQKLKLLGLEALSLKNVSAESVAEPSYILEAEPDSRGAAINPSLKATAEYVVEAYGQELIEIARNRTDIVVLDADLASDCRVRQFELTYPNRFIECGIAEQDMVSMAGGLARQGLLPVVNSFASFLASRSNEQIYNNASEKTKIIYVCHYAGLIPAGPGKSHQSIRDISLFGALPNCIILQPCNVEETKMVLRYAVEGAKENCMIRLIIGPSPRKITLPKGYKLTAGRGVPLADGKDALVFAYGPVMLHEALLASEILAEKGVGLKVVNMPWLNRIDSCWLEETVLPFKKIMVLEDHAPVGGLCDRLREELVLSGLLISRTLEQFAVENYPACGTPEEALRFHRLNGESLVERIMAVK